jgi:hypothetical protein
MHFFLRQGFFLSINRNFILLLGDIIYRRVASQKSHFLNMQFAEFLFVLRNRLCSATIFLS